MRKQNSIPSQYAESLLFVLRNMTISLTILTFFFFYAMHLQLLCNKQLFFIQVQHALQGTSLFVIYQVRYISSKHHLPILPYLIQVLQGRRVVALSSNSEKCSCTFLVFPCPDIPEQNSSAFTHALSFNNDGCIV